MHRHGFYYSCVGRSLTSPALADGAPLDDLQSIAKIRATTTSL
jgi:hypothetical protein